MLKRDWDRKKVKTTIPLRNSLIEIPAGTICTVTKNYGGLRLKSDACPHCGVAIIINKVPEDNVVLVSEYQGTVAPEEQKCEMSARDFTFLVEISEKLQTGLDNNDPEEIKYAKKMVDDWVDEITAQIHKRSR